MYVTLIYFDRASSIR